MFNIVCHFRSCYLAFLYGVYPRYVLIVSEESVLGKLRLYIQNFPILSSNGAIVLNLYGGGSLGLDLNSWG